jgi:hypothetical protein
MHSTPSNRNTRRLAMLALGLTLAVSLTACSELLATETQAAAVLSDPPKLSETKLPDIPGHLVKCIEKEPPAASTADKKVLALKLTAEERKACAKAILAWYRQIQAANKQAAAGSQKK